jgi:hypothetical protein
VTKNNPVPGISKFCIYENFTKFLNFKKWRFFVTQKTLFSFLAYILPISSFSIFEFLRFFKTFWEFLQEISKLSKTLFLKIWLTQNTTFCKISVL